MSWLLRASSLVPLIAPALSAQVVRVRAVEEGNRRPVAGALVSLRADPRQPLAQGLTDETGRALLNGPRAGRFLVRVDRIGYQGATVGPVMIRVGDTVSVDIVAPAARWMLPDLSVVSTERVTCRLDEHASATVAVLWTEARKALIGSELAQGRLPLLEVTRYERGYAPGSSIVEEASTRFRTDSVVPFIAADPAELARSGYLDRGGRGTIFYAPDAKVLLSDSFLSQHCFQVVTRPADSTLVGLGFEPVQDRKQPDVAGTLWLDRNTAELRYLEFGYTNLNKSFRTGHEGGRVDFVRLPNGHWITGKWRVRVAWHERGGEVALVGADGSAPAGSTVAGVVYDSLGGRPLEGAIVSVGGGAYADTTDAAGSYRIQIPTEGDFSITVSHPLLRLLDRSGTARSAAVIRGQEIRADFTVPSPEAVIQRTCPRRPLVRESEGVLIGRIADSTGVGQPGEVELEWSEPAILRPGYRTSIGESGYRVAVLSDLEGRFRVCGVPASIEIRIAARVGPAHAAHRATLVPGQVEIALLTLP